MFGEKAMRAVVVQSFGPIDNLAFIEAPEPTAGGDEVRVRVHAVGLGFADTLVIEGRYQIKPKLPFVPGGQGAGVVDAVGDGVGHLRPGDRVMWSGLTGGMAEWATVVADRAFPVPSGMTFAAAAGFVVNYATSYHALKDRAQLLPGETLLVLGASGAVGQTAVELGKAMGATVIAAASSPEKLALARELGATLTVDYAEQDLKTAVRSLTHGRGVDVIYDPVGGDLGLAAFRTLAWGGRHLVIGFAAGAIPALPYNIALLKGASLVGVDIVQFSTTKDPDRARANILQLVAMCEAGTLKPREGIAYPFEQAREALRAAAARHTLGKVLLQVR
jgi:NADPH2:quinone reductase